MVKKKSKRYVAGIDAGYGNCGIVVFDLSKKKFVYSECITPPAVKRNYKVEEFFERCQFVSNCLDIVADKFTLERIYCELPTGGSKSHSAIKGMAGAVAIIASFSTHNVIPMTLVTPTEIKRLVKPKGEVSKEEVQKVVEEKLTDYGFEYPNSKKQVKEHVADAAATLLVKSVI